MILNPEKFKDPFTTAKGEERASVELKGLETLWFNTGTRCNLSCTHCYIESTPKNDRLSFLDEKDVEKYLVEIKDLNLPVREIGLTGGEPFINPHIVKIVDACLEAEFPVLLLTNAVRIERYKKDILRWNRENPGKLVLRVSLDHYTREIHEEERGQGTFEPTLENIHWMAQNDVRYAVAGRTLSGEDKDKVTLLYSQMLNGKGIFVDPGSKESLVVFAEMDPEGDPPEITTACWGILNKSPDQMMCSSSRMIVKRKGEEQTRVLACTLLAYDRQFELGSTLAESKKEVQLNHPFCAQFCVLGGSSCS